MPPRSHGLSDTPIYSVWLAMRRRCRLSTSTNYERYGGRGIRVCDEWASSFEAFHAWASGNGYEPGLEIDRIDNDGHYEPSNCRWVTRKVNGQNKRSNIILTAFGEQKSVAAWSDDPRCAVGYMTLYNRHRSNLWDGDHERWITTPLSASHHERGLKASLSARSPR